MTEEPPKYTYTPPVPGPAMGVMPGQWLKMDPKVKAALTLKPLVGFLFIGLIMSGSLFGIFMEEGFPEEELCFAIPIIAIIVGLALAYTWAALYYDRYQYMVDDSAVYINRGILWKRNAVIPFERVQHTTITRGPLEILLGLHSLSIFTAGTASIGGGFGPGMNMMAAEGNIPGMRDPEPLKNYIMSQVKALKSGSGLGDSRPVQQAQPAQQGGDTQKEMLAELRAIRKLMEEGK